MNEENEAIIAKFGGTSVANFESMSRSADIITANPNVKVVVLSASAGVTNLLIALAAGSDSDQQKQILEQVKAIQYAILDRISPSEIVKKCVDDLLANIETLAKAASLATSNALTDEIVAHGELISSLLFVEILRSKGCPAKWFDIRQVMRTDAVFGKASPILAQLHPLTTQYLAPLLKDGVVVTQGFIGQEDSGKTTTLGRGGSDYTAALLGEALCVSRIDIWTDVPGIYTTDPRIVPEAYRINEIAFSEAAEMATFGAKILHPATLVPAVRSNIPVFVGSSKKPDAGGTFIYQETQNSPLFRALALRRNQTLLTLHSLNMLHAQGFLAKIFTILADHMISVDLITTSEVSVALTLDTTGSNTNGCSLLTESLLNELSQLCLVEVESDLSLVALIGNRLTHSKEISQAIFGELDDTMIRMACFGASSHNICLLVANNEAESVIQTLHKTLF